MKKMMTGLAVTVAAALIATSAFAQQKRTVLNLSTAKKMADVCEAKAKAEGWKVNIAIMDAGGNLKHFMRMDDAFMGSIQIAQLKANTSTSFPFTTKKWGEIAKMVPGLELVPGTATFEGGIPIMTSGGEHIGSIGVSGATGEQDGICAQAAVDAVKGDLQ